KVVGRFPPALPASVFVVWHLSPGLKSILPAVLQRSGPLRAEHARDGDRIEAGRIYVAPNDHHMLLENGYIRITKGPKENRFRPAIDPLFRSAAYIYGPRVIGVVLTGALDDGSAGLYTIKLRGGLTHEEAPQAPELPMDEKRKLESEIRIAEEAESIAKQILASGELSAF